MRTIILLIIIVMLSSCTQPPAPWPDDPIELDLELQGPTNVALHQGFNVTALITTNRNANDAIIEWKLIGIDEDYDANGPTIGVNNIPSLHTAKVRGVWGEDHYATFSLDMPQTFDSGGYLEGINNPYRLRMTLEPMIPFLDYTNTRKSLLGDILGSTYFKRYDEGVLTLMSVDLDTTLEISSIATYYASGNPVSVEILGIQREDEQVTCTDKNRGMLMVDSETGRVVENNTYTYMIDGTEQIYLTVISILIDEDDTAKSQGRFGLAYEDYEKNVMIFPGQTIPVTLGELEFNMTLFGVSCVPKEIHVNPRRAMITLNGETDSLTEGGRMYAQGTSLMVKDIMA